jgi:hypothetical protein
MIISLNSSFVKPVQAFLAGTIQQVRFVDTKGKSYFLIHGYHNPEYMLNKVSLHSKVYREVDFVLSCHNSYYPKWVANKVPKELQTDKPLIAVCKEYATHGSYLQIEIEP